MAVISQCECGSPVEWNRVVGWRQGNWVTQVYYLDGEPTHGCSRHVQAARTGQMPLFAPQLKEVG